MGAREWAHRGFRAMGLDVRRTGNTFHTVAALARLCDDSVRTPADRYAATRLFAGLGQLLDAGKTPLRQLLQDAMALGDCRGTGYFVEVGAGHPTALSNVARLIDPFGWTGVRIDPNPVFAKLHDETRLGGVTFVQAAIGETDRSGMQLVIAGERSTSVDLASADRHAAPRLKALGAGEIASVEVRRLDSLMEELGSPRRIEYLSVDTEGSEETVLRTFPFEMVNVDFISVEHNFDFGRMQAVGVMLAEYGYLQVMEHLSGWDSWYLHGQVMH